MSGGQIFEQPKKGLLSRLFGGGRRLGVNVKVRHSEHLNLRVPADKADTARAAVERWLQGHGVTAAVTTEEAEGGRVTLHAKLDPADAGKLDLADEHVQTELENALMDALT
jgi:hypothetical protein